MKEIFISKINKGEGRMKRTLFIAVLAMGLLLAVFATPAFAKYAGYSSSKQYVPWAEANSLASQNPDAASQAFGPHSGYATTTIKCAVCHSVHRGGNKLLNEGSACAYCHTSTAHGGGAVAADLISWDGAVNGGPHSSRCTNDDCHGGPHGVGSSQYAGPATRLISGKADTKIASDLAANGLAASTLDTWNANSRVIATGGLCSRFGCHVDSAFGVITAGSQMVAVIDSKSGAAGTTPGGEAGEMVTGHRVIAAATSNWNANGTDFPTTKTNLTIAYAGVSYCNSCHDLTDDLNGGKAAFPHAINDVVSASQGKVAGTRSAVWLTAGAYAGAAKTAVGPYNQYAATGGVSGAAGSSVLDGICLKCHKGSATTGVGSDY